MSDPAEQLAQDRRNRIAARKVFDTGLAQVRADLEARGIGGRIKDRAGQEAKAVFDEALDIASESKGILAATVAALVLWLARNPLMALLEDILAGDGNAGEDGGLTGDTPDKDGADNRD